MESLSELALGTMVIISLLAISGLVAVWDQLPAITAWVLDKFK